MNLGATLTYLRIISRDREWASLTPQERAERAKRWREEYVRRAT